MFHVSLKWWKIFAMTSFTFYQATMIFCGFIAHIVSNIRGMFCFKRGCFHATLRSLSNLIVIFVVLAIVAIFLLLQPLSWTINKLAMFDFKTRQLKALYQWKDDNIMLAHWEKCLNHQLISTLDHKYLV